MDKGGIAMRNWRYTLKSGVQLRKAVKEENVNAVCEALEAAWKEIHSQFPDEYEEYELENDLENVAEVRDSEDIEQADYLLGELYDYCDNTRIWVELD